MLTIRASGQDAKRPVKPMLNAIHAILDHNEEELVRLHSPLSILPSLGELITAGAIAALAVPAAGLLIPVSLGLTVAVPVGTTLLVWTVNRIVRSDEQ